MVIAHVSPTPLEGAAWAAAAAFREAGFDSFCIAPDAYDSGREMPTDYRLPPVGPAVAKLHAADLVICHQHRPCHERWYPKARPTVVWVHLPWRPGGRGSPPAAGGWPWGMSGGLQPGLQASGRPLPELAPLKHRLYQIGLKAPNRVRIAYCPDNAASRCQGSSACEATPAELADLNADVEVVAGLSFADRLRRMAAAHIVIDGCVSGSYGRASLEALALGCLVVNNCDSSRAWNIQRMTGGCGHPFELAEPPRLHERLQHLISLGPAVLAHMGRRNRDWLTGAWDPAELISRNLMPLIDAALNGRHWLVRGCPRSFQVR
jgi:hypothetical protein